VLKISDAVLYNCLKIFRSSHRPSLLLEEQSLHQQLDFKLDFSFCRLSKKHSVTA